MAGQACGNVQDRRTQRLGLGRSKFTVLVQAEELEVGEQVGGDVRSQDPSLVRPHPWTAGSGGGADPLIAAQAGGLIGAHAVFDYGVLAVQATITGGGRLPSLRCQSTRPAWTLVANAAAAQAGPGAGVPRQPRGHCPWRHHGRHRT